VGRKRLLKGSCREVDEKAMKVWNWGSRSSRTRCRGKGSSGSGSGRGTEEARRVLAGGGLAH
jgi:hypothetical protein